MVKQKREEELSLLQRPLGEVPAPTGPFGVTPSWWQLVAAQSDLCQHGEASG